MSNEQEKKKSNKQTARTKSARYAAAHTAERNKARRIAKHLKHCPNDGQARDAFDSCTYATAQNRKTAHAASPKRHIIAEVRKIARLAKRGIASQAAIRRAHLHEV